jgi:wobble nucleotide-excising tRNase
MNNYVSSGLTIDSSCEWRMFELAMGERAKELEEDRRIARQIYYTSGDKKKRTAVRAQLQEISEAKGKLEKTACNGYQRITNRFLKALNAPFHIKLTPKFDTRLTSCDYYIIMHDKEIPIIGRTITDQCHAIDFPDFSSTLSGGDRNTLALALFFAYLDRDKRLAKKVVVIDDPITSLDDHRARVTVEEIVSFVPRVMQMIVLSHDKRFLLRILEKMDHRLDLVKVLEVVRHGEGSIVREWNTKEDRITEHDRYHRLLLTYYSEGKGKKREVAAAIRPTLEGFVRVAYPEYMPAGTLCGRFLNTCRERIKHKSLGAPILNRRDVTELQNLLDFGNLFHHDTNPSFESQDVDDEELRGIIRRTIGFTRRPIRNETGGHSRG